MAEGVRGMCELAGSELKRGTGMNLVQLSYSEIVSVWDDELCFVCF